MREVTLPHEFDPRDYQMPAWSKLEDGVRRVLLFWHRRAGKDLVGLNWTAVASQERVGAYWHVFPTYKQGRAIAWEGQTKAGRAFLDHFPKQMISRIRDQEMTLNFRNGSMYKIVGADNPNSLVGTNPVGVIFSEWAVMTDESVWNYLQPILVENGGWAIFITTPRGRNHAYKMLKRNEDNPDWFCQVMTVDDSVHNGVRVVTESQIESARREGMTDDMVQQEFYCSFDAALKDAFFGTQMVAATKAGRITKVEYDPALQVETWWDLGMDDSTTIWFAQRSMGQIRLIDYYEGNGKSLGHYAGVVQKRQAEWDCSFRSHILPHDVNVRELSSGTKRSSTLRKLGVFPIRKIPRTNKADQIAQARQIIPLCWFDERRCERGIESLKQYVKKAIEGGEDPDGNPTYSNEPRHNWACHGADAFQTGAMGTRPDQSGDEKPLTIPMAMV